MKLRIFLLLLIAFIPQFSFARGGTLTIFSEDGNKFILFLNGAQQNNAGQTNLRLDGLTQPHYKARIVFEDKAKGQIEKNIAVTDAATNAPADVVYRIKNKDGKMVLRFFSAQPVQSNYTPPADMHVVHYGQPDPVTTVTQTTTFTNPNQGGGGSIGITPIGGGDGGVNINMGMGDPNGGATQTTTTTTTSNGGYDNSRPVASGCQSPMDWGSFKSAKETVKNAGFEDTKRSTAKSIISSNCLSTEQVIQICQLFGFEESKLRFAKDAYRKTTDPGNYFKVGNVFSFDASKTDLNNFIANGGR